MKKYLALTICLVLSVCLITGCGSKKKEEKKVFSVTNTSWTGRINDGVEFTSDEIMSYEKADDHSDNYFHGKYKLYIGNEAVEYITNDLKMYGITKDELQGLFDRNEKYDEENFVVFDIRYDYGMIDGERIEMGNTLIPWYGFILDDGTYLDVANMNSGSYLDYKLNK